VAAVTDWKESRETPTLGPLTNDPPGGRGVTRSDRLCVTGNKDFVKGQEGTNTVA